MTTPQVINVYPASSAKGIALGDQVKITFNQEMDLDSINSGTVVLTGPDDAPMFGPLDATPLDVRDFDDEDILSSPYFPGYVKCTISFLKIGVSSETLDDDAQDTTGEGDAWYTMAILTPDRPLRANTEYTCMVLGDASSTDEVESGVRTRTVFDTVFSGSGSGRLNFYGGYIGDENRSYTLEITTGGATGTAEYLWWNDNDPLTAYTGITTTGSRELEDGLYIICEPDGPFTIGDKFQVVVKPAEFMLANYKWSFSTGGENIIVPSSDSSASGIDYNTDLESLKVLSIIPNFATTNLDLDTNVICVEFNKNIDGSTLTSETMNLFSEPVNGIFNDNPIEYTGVLINTFAVVENVLTITLSADQLYNNNIIYLTLSKYIYAIDGTHLEEDYNSYFTTVCDPMYSSVRRIRLDMGRFLSNVSDDAINLAIYEASLMADLNSYQSSVINPTIFTAAKREYTTCLAELTLAKALLGDSSTAERLSKTLGDFSVSRGGNLNGLKEALDKFEDCAVRWEITLQSGGDLGPGQSIRPAVAVKGLFASDRITTSRTWEPSSGIGMGDSAANYERPYTSRRANRTFKSRGR